MAPHPVKSQTTFHSICLPGTMEGFTEWRSADSQTTSGIQ